MEPDKRLEEEEQAPASPLLEQKPPEKKTSPLTRALAWVGVALMVILTVGYFYVFYSGQIINW